jgi:hypothetical protein
MNRQSVLIPKVGGIGLQKLLPCPVCTKSVTVGGPHEGQWIFQPHSPNDDPTVLCSGSDQRVTASP